jgi:hypothetical protein
MACGFEYENADGHRRSCPRQEADGQKRCVFHLAPDERTAAGLSGTDLRAGVCADLRSEDRRRYEYVGVTVDALDLSSLVIDTDGIESIRFADVSVAGTLDLSESVTRTQVVLEDCRIGRLDAMDATFESDLTVADSRLGEETTGTCLTLRRATVSGRCRIDDTFVDGSAEFAGCTVDGYFDVDDVRVTAGAYFPNAAFGRVQIVGTEFDGPVQFTGVTADHATVERVRCSEPPRFDDAVLDTLRFQPTGNAECFLVGARVGAGHLGQPGTGRALYDLTDATVGDVDIDCDATTLDRYRFYRTRYEGFPFAAYREFFRENGWRLHEYAGDGETGTDTPGLERTYLEAKQGASAVGDHENAAAFFVREMRYRRLRYAEHMRDPSQTLVHRLSGALRWTTNGFLDLTAGFGERPQRTVAASLAVIVFSALVYPAVGGLKIADRTVTYAADGLAAFLDSLYFSVVTFTTLGYGDFLAVTGLGRLVAGVEALSGAFLVALFVFSLGRRVSR